MLFWGSLKSTQFQGGGVFIQQKLEYLLCLQESWPKHADLAASDSGPGSTLAPRINGSKWYVCILIPNVIYVYIYTYLFRENVFGRPNAFAD